MDRFTGIARIDPLFAAKAPGQVSAGSVTFESGARSNWHTHPLGQHLVVTSGLGWTQAEGGPVVEMRPGDVVWCPPDIRHWHGATATTSVTHMAIQEEVGGKNVVWQEPVTTRSIRLAAAPPKHSDGSAAEPHAPPRCVQAGSGRRSTNLSSVIG